MPVRPGVSCAWNTAPTSRSTPPVRTSAAAIKRVHGGKGANVIIDMVGGDLFDECRRAIASGGRIVIVGFTSNRIPEIQVNRLFLRNFAIVGLNTFHYKHEMTSAVHQHRRPLRGRALHADHRRPSPVRRRSRPCSPAWRTAQLHGKAVVVVNTLHLP